MRKYYPFWLVFCYKVQCLLQMCVSISLACKINRPELIIDSFAKMARQIQRMINQSSKLYLIIRYVDIITQSKFTLVKMFYVLIRMAVMAFQLILLIVSTTNPQFQRYYIVGKVEGLKQDK